MTQRQQSDNMKLILVFKLSPIYFSFLGGIFISFSINLFTGIFAVDCKPNKWRLILLSSFMSLISAILWTIIALILERIRPVAEEAPSYAGNKDSIWQGAIKPRYRILFWCFFIALLSGFMGLFILIA